MADDPHPRSRQRPSPRSALLALGLLASLPAATFAAPDGEQIAPEAPSATPAADAADPAVRQGGAPDRAPESPPEAPVADPPIESDADAEGGMTVGEARKRLFAAGREARFARTTLLERAAVDALVPMLLDRARRGEDRVADLQVMARLGRLVVERWAVHGQVYLALLEPEGDARGTGAYVFRVGRAGPFILQAPHAYFDLFTGRIAAGMFFGKRDGPRAAALFVNTLQRYERGEVRWGSRADVCRRPEHLFSLATDRALSAMPEATVIQLHGFDEEGVPDGVDMILSNGQRETPSVALHAMAERVRARFGDGVRLFPTEVPVLGGTTNVQGRIAGARRAGFVHVEMAKAVREAMSKQPKLRHRLAKALMGPAR